MPNHFTQILEEIETREMWSGSSLLSRNEYLKVKGSLDTNLYYVEQGCMRIFVQDNTEEHTIRFAYEGNMFASLDSYFSEQPSDLYMQAIKKTSIKILTKERFQFLLEEKPSLKNNWHLILESLILQQMERERDLLTSSPLARYKRVLARSPHLFQLIPHKYIASYLRMTPETLSRLKKS